MAHEQIHQRETTEYDDRFTSISIRAGDQRIGSNRLQSVEPDATGLESDGTSKMSRRGDDLTWTSDDRGTSGPDTAGALSGVKVTASSVGTTTELGPASWLSLHRVGLGSGPGISTDVLLDGYRIILRGPTKDYAVGTIGASLPVVPTNKICVVVLPLNPAQSPEEMASRIRGHHGWMYNSTGLLNAISDLGLEFTTSHFKRGDLTRAIELGMRGSLLGKGEPGRVRHNTYRASLVLSDLLLALDAFGAGPKMWPTGALAAAISSLAVWPETQEFWRRYAHQQGNMRLGGMDPVQAAVHAVMLPASGGGRAPIISLYRRMLKTAYNWHLMNRTGEAIWVRRLHSMDPAPVVTELWDTFGIRNDVSLSGFHGS